MDNDQNQEKCENYSMRAKYLQSKVTSPTISLFNKETSTLLESEVKSYTVRNYCRLYGEPPLILLFTLKPVIEEVPSFQTVWQPYSRGDFSEASILKSGLKMLEIKWFSFTSLNTASTF